MKMVFNSLGLLLGTLLCIGQIYAGPRILILESEARDEEMNLRGEEIFGLLKQQTGAALLDRYADKISLIYFDSSDPDAFVLGVERAAIASMNSIVPIPGQFGSILLYVSMESKDKAELLSNEVTKDDATLVVLIDTRRLSLLEKAANQAELAVKELMGGPRFTPDHFAEQGSLKSRVMRDPSSGSVVMQYLIKPDLNENSLLIRNSSSSDRNGDADHRYGVFHDTQAGDSIKFVSSAELKKDNDEVHSRRLALCIAAVRPMKTRT